MLYFSIMKKRSNNGEIAAIFYEMAEILDFKNIKWKPRAYIIAAQTLESLREDVSEIYNREGEKGIDNIPGIGEHLKQKIIQYIKEKRIDEYDKLRKSVPVGLYEMMKVPGVGAKKASLFYHKLGIKNIDELYRAVEEQKLRKLAGFKEKSEQKIMEGINILKNQKGRMPLKKAQKLANSILREIRKFLEVDKVIAAGSLRRKKSTIGDIDIVVRTEKPELVLKKFVKLGFVKDILGIGKEKATIINKDGVQIDCRVFTDEEFGAGLLYFTGDKQHNIWLRKIAIKKGWKLNEYGLFDNKNRRIAGMNEKEIYNKLGVKMLAPEKRIGETK